MKFRLRVYEASYVRAPDDRYAGGVLLLRVHQEPSGGFTASQELREPGEDDFTVRVWFAWRSSADRYVHDQEEMLRQEGWRHEYTFTSVPSMS